MNRYLFSSFFLACVLALAISLPVHAAGFDADFDGLSDADEARYGTDRLNPDTDGDGFFDGEEVSHGFDPLAGSRAKLSKKIIVSLAAQKLHYYLGKAEVGTMVVSSGTDAMPTPTGSFAITAKSPRAWSHAAHLWMPYWMAFAGNGKYGLHELPEWPNGKKEGEDHLGRKASHGCIRMGVKDAKKLYAWADIGTPVVVEQ